MTPERCPRCQTPIPADAPGGMCPSCLLDLGGEPELIETGGAEPLPAPPRPEEIQPLFPHLEIIGLIGRGGMGAVYEARQRGLNRQVALKLLWVPSAVDAGFEERFAREGRALAQLSHPNVVAIHDAGRSGPYYWLVMEYVDGPNLRALLRDGPVEPSRALSIVMQMCAALDYAHRRGIVHRDIKPENILLARSGRVKIADFGLAKVLARHPRNPTITRSEQAMGTPHYIAPEQIERPREVDHRADIYSLGVVLYEVLTGELPLGRFQLPSRRVPVDVRLDGIVTKALQKQPEQRYQHVSEVSTDIKSLSTGAGPARPRQPRAQARRQGVPSWAVAAAAALAIVLVGSWLVLSKGEGTNAGEVALTLEEQLEQGRRKVMFPESLLEGIGVLESAYERAPATDGLRDLLARSLVQAVQLHRKEGRVDSAVLAARRARALVPASFTADDEAALLDLARARWGAMVEVTEPVEGAVLSRAPERITGHIRNLPEDARLTIDGDGVEPVAGTFEHPIRVRGDGPCEVRIALETPAGLTIPLPLRFVVDTQPPEIEVEVPAPGALVGGTFVVSGRVLDASPRMVSVGEIRRPVKDDGTFIIDVECEEGEQRIELKADDGVGRITGKPLTVVVDRTPPSIDPLGHGFDITWRMKDEPIAMRVADENGIREASWGGQKLVVAADGIVRLAPSAAMAEGELDTRELVVVDRAGNPAARKIRLRRDDTAPQVTPLRKEDEVFPNSRYLVQGKYSDRSACTFVRPADGLEVPLEGDEFSVPVLVGNRAPGESFYEKFEIHDEAGNRINGERTLKVIAPCLTCEQVDGKRGKCRDCGGKGEKVRGCSKCTDGEVQNDCAFCAATGKATCLACNGTGKGAPVPCNRCGGGQVTCGTCKGAGTTQVYCGDVHPDCNGGKVYPTGLLRPYTCPYCKGTTRFDAKCKTCRGEQTVACSHCENGYTAMPCPRCTKGHTQAPCGECNGSGKVSGECPKCHGQGEKTSPCYKCSKTGNCLTCGGDGKWREGAPEAVAPVR